jgi:hypothetical protein
LALLQFEFAFKETPTISLLWFPGLITRNSPDRDPIGSRNEKTANPLSCNLVRTQYGKWIAVPAVDHGFDFRIIKSRSRHVPVLPVSIRNRV